MRRIVSALVVVLGVAFAAGFVRFTEVAARQPGRVPRADGIVVLTGGTHRVEEGLRLLALGRAPRLLISGVAPGTTLAALTRGTGVAADAVAGRVELGQQAVSTRGNAAEARAFAGRYGLHSLIVVTAFYHMPRAMAELRRAVPGVVLRPWPVLPEALRGGDVQTPLLMLAKEYVKWLAVRAGLPHPGPDTREEAG